MHELKDLMSRNVKVIGPDMSIQEAAAQMSAGGFGLMPVGTAEEMIGTVSDRDIAVRAVALGKGPDTKVREVMTSGVAFLKESDTVDQAVKVMSERQVRRLPVVDENNKLVGIVALGDLAIKSSESQPAAQALTEISKP